MTDAIAATTAILGSGAITTLVGYVLNRTRESRKTFEEQMNQRMDESIAIRSSDRDRLTALEQWRDHAIDELNGLHTDKLTLTTQVTVLKQQIADLNLQITTYQQNEIAFHAQIHELQERLAAKSGELRKAEERLEIIKVAHSKGELTSVVLHQRNNQ